MSQEVDFSASHLDHTTVVHVKDKKKKTLSSFVFVLVKGFELLFFFIFFWGVGGIYGPPPSRCMCMPPPLSMSTGGVSMAKMPLLGK
jgi:hypothetical protein